MAITLLSDFGDVYPASMKGVILSIQPDASIIDITHSIPRHDVRAGAFILKTAAKYFPSGTVHIAVVDPGVGTKRRPIAIKALSDKNELHYFVGPDNGLLIPAAGSIGRMEVYEITNRMIVHDGISDTFHGRDIFAPAGAHIFRGLNIEEIGVLLSDFEIIDFGTPIKNHSFLQGDVIYIDHFGNIITSIPSEMVGFKTCDKLEIDHKKLRFARSYGYLKEGEPLALIGSHGHLEIAINRGNAAQMFSKRPGDKIIISIYS